MDEAAFLRNELVQDAVIRNIEIIGEAANDVRKSDPDFVAAHDEVPWAVVYAMRNRVAHGYHEVDLSIVWKTVQTALPDLLVKVEALRRDLERAP